MQAPNRTRSRAPSVPRCGSRTTPAVPSGWWAIRRCFC